MSACTQCGTPARPTDKFCNACGTPIARASAPAVPAGVAYPPPPPYAPPAPVAAPPDVGYAGFAPSQPAHCQQGHEIAPGASYCAQGHPIALDQMQFANDAYPLPSVSYAGTPPPPPLPSLQGVPPPFSGATAFAPVPAPPPFGQLPAPPAFSPPPAPPPYGAAVAGTAYAMVETGREPAPPKALRGFLVTFATNPNGDFWPLTGGRLVIGRMGAAERTDIGLQDPTISSRHAAMWVDATTGVVTVEDTGSTNGTFVNDEHIGFNGKRDLRDGDRVRFGAFTTIVKVLGRV
ncbi:MAG TPA: FHA domain-containing protein [Polyangiaceae bacterium]|jgi:cold shock CspA family protein